MAEDIKLNLGHGYRSTRFFLQGRALASLLRARAFDEDVDSTIRKLVEMQCELQFPNSARARSLMPLFDLYDLSRVDHADTAHCGGFIVEDDAFVPAPMEAAIHD